MYQEASGSPQRPATTAPAARYGPNGIALFRPFPIASATIGAEPAEHDRRGRRDAHEAEPQGAEDEADQRSELHVPHPHPAGDRRDDEEHPAVEEEPERRLHGVRGVPDQPREQDHTANRRRAG